MAAMTAKLQQMEQQMQERAAEAASAAAAMAKPLRSILHTGELPVWIAVGGTPQSVARTGMLGLPMALAIIGGMPERFAPLAELHRRAAEEAGHSRPALSINSHGYIAETSQKAADEAFPSFAETMNRIGRARGWQPLTRADFEAPRSLRGSSFVGSPAEVTEKILFQHEIFGHQRFMVQFSVGSMPHENLMRSIELFGTQVAPAVRKEIATKTDSTKPPAVLT